MTRTEFEHFLASPPYELDVTRRPDDPARTNWPGHYRVYVVQLAWEVLVEAKRRKKEREETS